MTCSFAYLAAIEEMVESYLKLITSGAGLAALAVGGVMAILTVLVDGVKWVWLTLLLWVGSFGTDLRPEERFNLLPGLQQVQVYSRGIIFSLMGILLIPLLTSGRGNRIRVFSLAAAAFFLFEIAFSVRYLWDPKDADRGIYGGVSYVLLYLTLGLGLPRWLQTPRDRDRLFKAVLCSGLLVVGSTILQMIGGYSNAFLGARLKGTTVNPQHLGGTLALLMPITILILSRANEKAIWRLVAGFMAVVGLMFIAWTGSRTAVITTLIGIALLFRTRLHLWATTIILCGTLALIAISVFDLRIIGAEHLIDTTNSRSMIWTRQWETFVSNPLLGIGFAGAGENSYLGTAAMFGLWGLLPMALAYTLTAVEIASASRRVRRLDGRSLLPNFIVAWFSAFAVVCIFEDFIVGTSTTMVFCIYIMLAVVTTLRDPTFDEPASLAANEGEVDHDHSADHDPFQQPYPAPHTEAYL